MRSTGDRIRHALGFEIIGLVLVTPLGAWIFHFPISQIGIVSLLSATIATGWNYLYNLAFDHLMQRLTGNAHKTPGLRIIHAILFEAGLLLVLMPFFAWFLGISFLHALLMDAGFALSYVVYAFVFNWAYDWIFPLPEWREAKNAIK